MPIDLPIKHGPITLERPSPDIPLRRQISSIDGTLSFEFNSPIVLPLDDITLTHYFGIYRESIINEDKRHETPRLKGLDSLIFQILVRTLPEYVDNEFYQVGQYEHQFNRKDSASTPNASELRLVSTNDFGPKAFLDISVEGVGGFEPYLMVGGTPVMRPFHKHTTDLKEHWEIADGTPTRPVLRSGTFKGYVELPTEFSKNGVKYYDYVKLAILRSLIDGSDVDLSLVRSVVGNQQDLGIDNFPIISGGKIHSASLTVASIYNPDIGRMRKAVVHAGNIADFYVRNGVHLKEAGRKVGGAYAVYSGQRQELASKLAYINSFSRRVKETSGASIDQIDETKFLAPLDQKIGEMLRPANEELARMRGDFPADLRKYMIRRSLPRN